MVARPAGRDSANLETRIDSRWVEGALGPDRPNRPKPPARRAGGLLLLGLLGAVVVVLWLRLLAGEPYLPLTWRSTADGAILLESSSDAALRPAYGHRLQAVVLADGQRIEASDALPPRSPRWVVDDRLRQHQQAQRESLSAATHQAQLTLLFDHDLAIVLTPQRRGLGHLGLLCWSL